MSALAALALYRWRALGAAQRELERWRSRAAEIPAGALRDAALGALVEKRANPEATAVFATLAPRRRLGAVVRAGVALQVAVDYLDSLGEQGDGDRLADGLALHGALCDAVSPGAEGGDWYRDHRERRDGGYLAALVEACRTELAALPGLGAVSPALRRAARRCGEGQSHTHAAAGTLQGWAAGLETGPGYRWWEVAAGASSSVAAHALIAAAARPGCSPEQAERIDAAYFPSIGALSVLLDDLIDREADRAAGEHNHLAYYGGPEEAAERIALLAERARAALAGLPGARGHGAILAGVVAFYLSASADADPYAAAVRERLRGSLGADVRVIMAARRLRSV